MKKVDKRCELDSTLNLIKIGKGKGELRKLLGISASALSNRLRRLEKLGCIELIGKYQINYISSSHKHPRVTTNLISKKLNKRGHAYNIKVLFPKEIDDLKLKDKVQRELRQKRIIPLEFGSYQLKYKKYTIWINKSSLTIYSNNYYSSDNALYSKFKALKDIDNLIKYLKERYEFGGIYGIEVFREHYGLIFNKFADWLIKQKRKMDIKDKGNKSILWVDDSRKDDIGLKEFEGKNPIEINRADKLFESHEKTNWDVTPEFVLNGLNKLAINQSKQNEDISLFAEQLNKHIPAYEGMATMLKETRDEIRNLKEVIQDLKK